MKKIAAAIAALAIPFAAFAAPGQGMGQGQGVGQGQGMSQGQKGSGSSINCPHYDDSERAPLSQLAAQVEKEGVKLRGIGYGKSDCAMARGEVNGKFMMLALDAKTGKTLYTRDAKDKRGKKKDFDGDERKDKKEKKRQKKDRKSKGNCISGGECGWQAAPGAQAAPEATNAAGANAAAAAQ